MKTFVYIFFIIINFSMVVAAQSVNYLTSFSFAQSFSMAGAATAMQNDYESILYNPAAKYFSDSPQLHIYINPVSSYLALNNLDYLQDREDTSPLSWLSYFGLYAKAVSFVSSSFQMNLLLNEELPANPYRTDLQNPQIDGLLDWHFHTLSASIRFAEQVSIGAALYAFNTTMPSSDSLNYELGACYSILMKPSDKFSAGISYYSLPENVDSLFFQHFHLSSETINLGISYRPANFINLALDVRNVSEQAKPANLELHLGTQLNFWSIFRLNAGFSEYTESELRCFAAGAGIGGTQLRPGKPFLRLLNHANLSYAVQMMQFKDSYSYNHYLTFLIKL